MLLAMRARQQRVLEQRLDTKQEGDSSKKVLLSIRESNPGLPRDKRTS
jgi:hypothetical protein